MKSCIHRRKHHKKAETNATFRKHTVILDQLYANTFSPVFLFFWIVAAINQSVLCEPQFLIYIYSSHPPLLSHKCYHIYAFERLTEGYEWWKFHQFMVLLWYSAICCYFYFLYPIWGKRKFFLFVWMRKAQILADFCWSLSVRWTQTNTLPCQKILKVLETSRLPVLPGKKVRSGISVPLRRLSHKKLS